PFEYVPIGTWVPNQRRTQRGKHFRKWHYRTVIVISLVALLFAFSGCQKSKSLIADQMFQSARKKFIRGHLVAAQQSAEEGLQQFSKTDPQWEWQFRLLTADILLKRGLNHEVLTLLDAPLPANLN